MNSRKILTNFIVSLSFWVGIVFVLLSIDSGFQENSIPPSVSASIEEHDSKQIDNVILDRIPIISSINTEIAGEIEKGESLDLAMKRLKVSDEVRVNVINGFSTTLNFKTLQPGDRFTIVLDQENSMTSATYEAGLLHTHVLKRDEDGIYQSSREAVPLEYRVERLSGIIESSLYEAFSELDEEPKLIHAFADIFSSKIDFNTETMTGDRFELLVEKYYKGDMFVGYGRILVASYHKENVVYQGYHYASEKTPAGYFDQNGEALGTWLIRSPIPFGRVTSRFTMRRKHPVDGVIKPHLGVDLAAPRGTPVMATGDGKVEYIGRKGGFGKTVIIRHPGGYKTYYGHLQGYKNGLQKGSNVQQKDIIGYVGSTGISTGPHLDYRIQYNGIFKNPFGIKFKAQTILQDDELADFLQASGSIAELLNADSEEKILQVKNITLTDEHTISFL